MNEQLCEHLNKYLFGSIWNSPLKEFRRTILPHMLNGRSVQGIYMDPLHQVKLPTTADPYYLYVIDQSVLGKTISANEWITVASYIGNGRLSIRLHTDEGELLYRNQVWMKEGWDGKILYIAVDKYMLAAIAEGMSSFEPSKVYMAIYYDSNPEDNVTRELAILDTDQLRDQFFNKALHSDTSRVFLDGNEARVTQLSDLKLGARIEVIKDANVQYSFELDLTTDADTSQYVSSTDATIKQIVHIPKALNPDNRVITHNTCDIYVRPTNGLPGNNLRGKLLHRCQTKHPITQLTHNDFSIPVVVLDAFRSSIGSADISLYVECRHHGKDQYLLREKMYIDLLYTLPDEEIIKFFIDEGDRTLPFWTATELENAPYPKMLFDSPSYVTAENIDKYVNVFGYNRVLSLIGPRVHRHLKTVELERDFFISIPLLFQSKPLTANVFMDGLKIPKSLTTTSINSPTNMQIVIDPSYPWPANGEVIVEFLESPDVPAYQFVPTDENMSISITYSNFNLYQETTGAVFTGVNKTSDKVFIPIPISSGIASSVTIDGITTITFTDTAKNNIYHIQCEQGSFSIEKDLAPLYSFAEPFTIDLEVTTENTLVRVPILGQKATIVYLNGKELIPNVDFQIITLETSAENESFSQILIQNLEYITEDNNTAEVHILRDSIINQKSGFIGEPIIEDADVASTWLDGLSVAVVDGKLIKDIAILGNAAVIGNYTPRLGAFYGVRTVVPATIKEFLSDYSTDDDTARISLINTYLNSVPNGPDDAYQWLEHSHKIYSVFTHMIIRDILGGNFTLGVETDRDKILKAVSSYDYLRAFDVVFRPNLNLKFIDAYPTYRNFNTDDMLQYQAIHQLVEAALPPDAITHGDVVS